MYKQFITDIILLVYNFKRFFMIMIGTLRFFNDLYVTILCYVLCMYSKIIWERLLNW